MSDKAAYSLGETPLAFLKKRQTERSAVHSYVAGYVVQCDVSFGIADYVDLYPIQSRFLVVLIADHSHIADALSGQ